MAPTSRVVSSQHGSILFERQGSTAGSSAGDWRTNASQEQLILESWAQGVTVGSLLIMAFITIANMRRGVLLHKLILMELLLAMSHGTFAFGGTNWYLSSTAALLYTSWVIHNIVAFMKVRPFLRTPGGFFRPVFGLWTTRIYIGTLVLVLPVIGFQISDNFRFFNENRGFYRQVRPYEPLMRDPWWIFCCALLLAVLSRCYGTGVLQLIRRSPRFGILLGSIFASLVFTVLDVADGIAVFTSRTSGINPWWKLGLVFKCLTDTIVLDDFKTELKRLGLRRIKMEERRRNTLSLVDERTPDGMNSDWESDSRASSQPPRENITWFSRRERRSTPTDSSATVAGDDIDPLSNECHNSLPKAEVGTQEVELVTAVKGRSSEEDVSAKSCEKVAPSNKNRVNTDLRKDEVHGHTVRIGMLPKLKEWSFEAVKPGKRSRNNVGDRATQSRSEENMLQPTTEHSNTDGVHVQCTQNVANNRGRQPVSTFNIDAASTTTRSTSRSRRHERFKKSIGAREFMLHQ